MPDYDQKKSDAQKELTTKLLAENDELRKALRDCDGRSIKMTKEWLIEKIEEKRKYQHSLDEMIYEDFESLAVEVNNSGPARQIEYLINRGMTLQEIGAHLDIYFPDEPDRSIELDEQKCKTCIEKIKNILSPEVGWGTSTTETIQQIKNVLSQP